MNHSSRMPGWVPGFLLLLAILGLIYTSDTPENLLWGGSVITFPLVIIAAAFLLKPYFGFVFALLSLGEQLIIAYVFYDRLVEVLMQGFSLADYHPHFWELPNPFIWIVILLIGFIVWYAGYTIEKYLQDARSLASQRGAILESITDGVLVFDLSGRAIAKNSAACIMLGWVVNSIEEIAAAAKESEPMETLLFLASGEKSAGLIDWNKRPLILTGSPVTSPAGERIGIAVTIHDFTPQTQVERAKDTILALSSHEMRTPLAIMMGYAQMLQKTIGQNQDDNFRNGLASIVTNAKRLENTLSSMSTLAELQAGRLSIEKKTIKSSDLLLFLEPFKQHAREKGLEFRVVRDLPDRSLTTDPVRIKQVLDNLVGNAIKFTESGGVIVRFYEKDGSRWGVQITDTGPGVEKDRMPALFEAFSLAGNDYATRSFQGIGLGLTVTKHLVEMMGGEISVQSQVGIGSTFEIEFPLGGDQYEQ